MASILFYGSTGLTYEFGAGNSGLGFYSSDGFGGAVQVGAYNGRTYVTNANGTSAGPECNNVKYLSSTSGIMGQVGTGLPLTYMPNAQSTLRVSFTHSTAVRTQNGKLIIYDRNNTPAEEHPASGVSTYVAELRHPNPNQVAGGSGNPTWTLFTPTITGTILLLTDSPGTNGLRPSGANTYDTQHDWYFAISATPTSIGSKTQYGLFFSVEYL